MRNLLDHDTILVMLSALLVAVFFLLSFVQSHFIGYILYRSLCVGDILFHEMGHAITSWVFGSPAIPSILTVFGADKAGGYTPYWPHSWAVQGTVWAAMAYGCNWLRLWRPALFLPVAAFCLVLVMLSFTSATEVLRSYMGHGGAILAGGVLLYRAWLNIIVSTAFERWFNALFGFFIVLNNADFARQLLFSPHFRARYEESELTMDFLHIVDVMPFWRIEGIAWFTLVFAFATLVLSFILAAYFYEDEHIVD